ncbi:type III secretion protein [Acetobacter fabarum]|jgi:flagellar biosynthetic protein FliR|uniref:Flagellar biosynthesis protein FliR n=2 Tax=Acetobacter fabarum TaxID=483199 RepID=A0A269XWP3_9PROT|nr:type III secretion protein [Acetobacter fabarum]OUI98117.1 flagellar biosynthesis protein FliR [Acetobacter sp. DsW_54]PAK77702.1 flagellar biosynthesis protein FliR [Acetobacter fabarum]PEN24096.1 type III secretion protein [Acetobacter fabarum]GBQ37323.1 putative flagellar biosynthetic protein fliR [Acetobacter fabarum DSM 19596]
MTDYLLFPGGSIQVLAATFLLVLCRVSALVMASPGLGESTSPMVVRAGIALCITVAILPLEQNALKDVSGQALHMPARAIAIIAGELLYGIFIGWLARLISLALGISMQFVAIFTGLASVLQPDPDLGAGSTAISHMASFLVPVIFLSTGLYALPLAAITGSYSVFPPGHVPMVGDMARSVTQVTSQTFMLAFQLSAPFVLIGTLWPAMLGVLNRLMPSIQVYSMAMPAQLLGGVLLLAILIQVMSGVWQERAGDMLLGLPGIGATPAHH